MADEPSASSLLSVAEAIAVIDAAEVVPRIVEVRLDDADGRTLARDVAADRDFPPFDKSLMDGFAVRAGDFGEMAAAPPRRIGTVQAGDAPQAPLRSGEAMAIMTGAPLPAGADAVVPIEHATRAAEGLVTSDRPVSPGQFVARRGSDLRAGEIVLRAGQRLGPAQLAVAASVGAIRLGCFARPRVAILATGNEIVSPDAAPGLAQTRDASSEMLAALFRRLGADVRALGIVPDRCDTVRDAIASAMTDHDVLLVSGGMSMGDFDYVPRVLAELGVELRVTKLKIKPGKPFVFGAMKRATGPGYVFGLPGNPVSGFVCSLRLASRLLRRMVGLDPEPSWQSASLATDLPANGAREFYQPAVVEAGMVSPLKWKSSADVFTLARANGLLVRPEGEPALPAGSIVRVMEVP